MTNTAGITVESNLDFAIIEAILTEHLYILPPIPLYVHGAKQPTEYPYYTFVTRSVYMRKDRFWIDITLWLANGKVRDRFIELLHDFKTHKTNVCTHFTSNSSNPNHPEYIKPFDINLFDQDYSEVLIQHIRDVTAKLIGVHDK